jgi:hypothetical protein
MASALGKALPLSPDEESVPCALPIVSRRGTIPARDGGTCMQIPILIEAVAGNGYRSRGGEPYALSADGATREEVLAKLQAQLAARIEAGAAIVPLELPSGMHPLVEFAGMFEHNPLFDDWKAEMAEYRRKINEDPDIP